MKIGIKKEDFKNPLKMVGVKGRNSNLVKCVNRLINSVKNADNVLVLEQFISFKKELEFLKAS